MNSFSLSTLDLWVIGGYFAFIIVLGLWIGQKLKTAEDYFLAGRSMLWPFVGVSLFASNISNANLLGLAGEAYNSGIAVFSYEWLAVIVLVFFAVFILPIYLKSRIYTLPEFLEKRFDARSRYYFSGLALVSTLVIDAAAILYAGALVVQLILPEMPIWQIVAILAVVAGSYTISGGLAAVIYTDAIQAFLLFMGSIVITVVAFNTIGGMEGVRELATPGTFNLIRPIDDKALPWPALIISLPLLGFYYWTTNQFITQRVLSAKNIEHGRYGVLFACVLKLSPLFIMILPGVMARKLYPNLPNGDLVLPTMIFDLLPHGLIGLVIAGVCAALMSSLDSTLNSASTLITMDFVHKSRPQYDAEKLMRIGRWFTLAFMIFAVLWAPQIARFDSLFRYLQTMLSYITPPVAAVFLWGIFWRKTSSDAAFLSLLIGMVAGVGLFMARSVFEVIDMHFLYIAPTLFVIASLSIVLLSHARPGSPAGIEELMWSRTSYDAETQALRTGAWYRNYRILGALVVSATAALVYVFR